MDISSVTYAYPISQEFELGDTPINVGDLKALFEGFFVGTDSRFLELRDVLIDELNKIFEKEDDKQIKPSDTYDHITFAKFVSEYADDCIEGVNAYKFYGNQIVNQINKLTDYIKKANELLAKWDTLPVNNGSDQAISDQIHSDVVNLECLVKFCLEIETKFCKRYIYDFDEDNWKANYDHYFSVKSSGSVVDGTVVFDDSEHNDDLEKFNPNTQIDTSTVKSLSDLRSLKVFCDRRGKKTEEGTPYYKKILECYNELNLLDRLKYIKVYYDLTGGKTDYVFPKDATFGLPCVKDEEKNGKTTKYIANIEKFYLGYLIDRDGPVNAFAGFFEMKVKALESAITLKQEELKALNAYLTFINRGLDVLNGSQSEGNHRICDGAIIAVTYLLGQKMYKLFEQDGQSYLVLPTILPIPAEEKDQHYFLVENSEAGMMFLLGNKGDANNCMGNGACGVSKNDKNEGLWYCTPYNEAYNFFDNRGIQAYKANGTKNVSGNTVSNYETISISNFSLPDELEVNPIDPISVYNYDNATSNWTDKEDTNDHVKWPTVIESWTKAFQTKTTYLNTTLQSTQTDIQTFRDTINTFESLTKTLRSRTHDAAINVVSKLIS